MSKLAKVMTECDKNDEVCERERKHGYMRGPPRNPAMLALVKAAAVRLAEDISQPQRLEDDMHTAPSHQNFTYKLVRGYRYAALPRLIEEAAIDLRIYAAPGSEVEATKMETLEKYLKAVSIEEQVTVLLSEGWNLHGPVHVDMSGSWTQSMVMRKPEPVVNNLLD